MAPSLSAALEHTVHLPLSGVKSRFARAMEVPACSLGLLPFVFLLCLVVLVLVSRRDTDAQALPGSDVSLTGSSGGTAFRWP